MGTNGAWLWCMVVAQVEAVYLVLLERADDARHSVKAGACL